MKILNLLKILEYYKKNKKKLDKKKEKDNKEITDRLLKEANTGDFVFVRWYKNLARRHIQRTSLNPTTHIHFVLK